MSFKNISTEVIKENKNKWLPRIFIILFACLIILFPLPSFEGAKDGLLLWFNTVLPTLLPFMIISNLIINTGLANILGKFLYPVFRVFFRLSPNACYPVLIGFLSGIPVSAKAISDLVSKDDLSVNEGQYILSFSNNPSPIFIMTFIAVSQLHMPSIRFHLLFINYISGLIAALIYFKLIPLSKNISSKKYYISTQELKEPLTQANPLIKFDFSIFDKAIMDSFEVITKVGAYIILFSIPNRIISASNFISSYIKVLSISSLEITTGISHIINNFDNIRIKIVLIVAITAFGGLSALAQTNSVINNSRLSIVIYFKNKIIHMLIAIILAIIYTSLYL